MLDLYLFEKGIMFLRNQTLMRMHRRWPGVADFSQLTRVPTSAGWFGFSPAPLHWWLLAVALPLALVVLLKYLRRARGDARHRTWAGAAPADPHHGPRNGR